MRTVVAVVAAALLLAGCGSSAESEPTSQPIPSAAWHLADDSTITYELKDASVPPKMHRSETITVTKDTTRLVIDSYGDVLADKTEPTPPEVWQILDGEMTEAATMVVHQDPKGCTGGTGRTLQVVTGDAMVVNVVAEFCGGSNTGLDTRIDAWINPARALFPPTDELAPRNS